MKRESGLTLIEVLIALVVLSIGLLGLAGLQAQGMRFNHEAYLRTQATILAYDMLDRMRANRAAALSGNYDIALATDPVGVTVAATDLADWKTMLEENLPTGDGAVDVEASGVAVVVVQWDETRGVGDLTQFVLRTQL